MDVYGYFLKDYYFNKSETTVWLHNNYGEAEELPVDAFFRKEEDMPDIELYALSLCEGKILDIGAGTGTHSLVLQQRGFDVTAIEISKGACEIMKDRKIKNVVNLDITQFNAEKFDTLFLMMNGIGFCGYIDELKKFLKQAKELIHVNGKIIFDSSDVAYLYEDDITREESYYGEIDYQYEYKAFKGDWFNWLYIDQFLMQKISNDLGWNMQVVYEDDQDQYLAVLTLK